MATGQCDGWKNVSKTPVVTSLMTVESQVRFEELLQVENLES